MTYTPNAGWTGSDSFTYKANDGHLDSNTATVTITVKAVNHAPVVNAVSVSTNQDTAVQITLNGTDIDGDALTYAIVGGPGHGNLGTVSGAKVTYTPNAGWTGSDSFTYKANDGHLDSNTATVTITVKAVDTTPPVITVPANMTVEATASYGAVVKFTATAVDAVDGAVPCKATPASGSKFPLGTTTVKVTATDKAGNTATKTFTVTVVDTTPPVIIVPANMTVEATASYGAVVKFTATAVDAVDGAVPCKATPASGSKFPLGTTRVKVTATDKAGNTASKTFRVKVVDTTGPDINASDSYSVNATGPAGALVTATMLNIKAVDKVDGNVPITYSPALPHTFPLGVSTLRLTAQDSHGNKTTETTKIYVTYDWGRWVQPSSSVYQSGDTIKVAFTIDHTGGTPMITTALAYLTVRDSSGARKINHKPFTYYAGADQYRFYSGATYGFSTTGWALGGYTLSVDLGDGVSHTDTISLTTK